MNRLLGAAILLLPLAALCAADGEDAPMPRETDYTLLWWAEGPPQFLTSKAPPASETLCFQSGTWGLAFDARQVCALRAGTFPAPMPWEKAMQPGRAGLDSLPPAAWECAVVADGRRFKCVGHMTPKDEFFQPVRFVESGRFFQRVVIEGLKFADTGGKEFACEARLEISAWPDRLSLRLDVEPRDPSAKGVVEMRLGDSRAQANLDAKTSVRLEVFGDGTAPRPAVETAPELKVEYDESLGCHTLALPEKPWSNAKGTPYPEEHLDRLDRWHIVLRNDSDRPATARLMFTQQHHLPITGFTPMLCDTEGNPTGIPVQISKNWHQRREKGVLSHQGPWFHGITFVRLLPKSKQDFIFQMAYARYGGVCAASHAQLCLIGWGHNQFWDQAAIGSFGESICFEPGRVQRRCFIDDVRPLMTLPQGKPGKPYGWAENCGGGDFLMWQDAQGRYQPMHATRTAYRAYGPCLTDVLYAEESAGGELAASMNVSLPRSDDHLRTFFRLRYDVRRPMQWQRLAFFQLGADFYNDTPARRVAIGDRQGLAMEWQPKLAKDVYDHRAVPLPGSQPWVSIHGLQRGALHPGRAAASRGLILRSWKAVLGGQPAGPHVSLFCTEWGKGNYRTVIELAPPPGVTELRPGDSVQADLELVVFPADAAAYYGPDPSLRAALTHDPDTWRLVQREAAGNLLTIQAQRGTVTNAYPLAMTVDAQQAAAASVQGGLGYVPVTFAGLDAPRGYELLLDEKPVSQAVHGNDFWQADYDTGSRKWKITYNVPLGSDRAHTLSFRKTP